MNAILQDNFPLQFRTAFSNSWKFDCVNFFKFTIFSEFLKFWFQVLAGSNVKARSNRYFLSSIHIKSISFAWGYLKYKCIKSFAQCNILLFPIFSNMFFKWIQDYVFFLAYLEALMIFKPLRTLKGRTQTTFDTISIVRQKRSAKLTLLRS